MNRESPFQLSSLVLIVACILCGVTAASYLVALSSLHANADEQISVAANLLRMSLSEFQSNGREVAVQSPQPIAASRLPIFPASSSVPRTVHPVTVNIDNSGIIREISRVHERLDLLSHEAGSTQHPMAPAPDVSTFAPVQHPVTQETKGTFEYKVYEEPATGEAASLPAIEF